MEQGVVKWFNPLKKFGFICPTHGGPDVFVHISQVEKAGLYTLKEGQRINYDCQMERGKVSACNLIVD